MTIEYETAIRNEIENWPGVGVSFGLRSKHGQALIEYQGKSRFVVIPLSPSDGRRGAKNSIAEVRRECRALGAKRTETAPAIGRKYRKPAQRPRRESMPNVERAPVKGNPFDALAQIQFAPPKKSMSVRLWQALCAIFKGKTSA